jgi:UDP-N-acetylmuramoyl-tripeptide--D-alanyl-D-alanine ligase
MKSRKMKTLEAVLRWMAKIILKKYKPIVIGISGSVGKTSAKEAIFAVLSPKFRTRKNEKNYNNEIGIPLTIIGAESGNKSLWKWLKIFAKWLAVVILPFEYPEVLVLEMGVDRPGDMRYLLSFIPVRVCVITRIASSHLEFFENIDHIAKEKGRLAEVLPEEGMAILNADDERILKMKELTKARIITFGIDNEADVRATDITYNYQDKKLSGIGFKLNYEGKIIPVRLHYVLARHQIYAALASAAIGITFKINLVDIAASLENFFSPPGRMNLISGIRGSLIIDDTYNSSPISALAALDVMQEIQATRKIAVFGDMLELGKETEKGHKEVAQKIFSTKVDLFLAVGERMEVAFRELHSLGYPAINLFYFESPETAAKKLKEIIREEDLILVKGSQGMRMEKVVEEIMAKPGKADEFLCRQSKEWRKKPFVKL